MYSDDIMACYFFRFTLLIPFFSLLLVHVSEEFEKKFNEEREQRRLMLVPQISLIILYEKDWVVAYESWDTLGR